jgi:phosphohistidine phosphatase SixA
MPRPLGALAALAALLLLAVSAVPAGAADRDAVWTLLQRGGQVVMIRHAETTPGAGDPPGMRLDDCATQRNLSGEGRRHARRLGEAFQARGVPIARVLSSPWCRCLETARLAFGAAEVWTPLANLYGRGDRRAEQVAEMRTLLAAPRSAGTLVLLSHGSTISALTGATPEPAEVVVVALDDRARPVVTGRLTVP